MAPFCPNCRSEYEQEVERCSECDSPLVEQLAPENPDAEPRIPLVEVYEASGDREALVIKGLLESEGIMCSLSSDVPHSVIPVNIDGLGTVRITVSQRDADRAKEIISVYRMENGAGEEL
ncbi:DUF2007 domain-containing protein [Candidatus Poribacteria bacterium]|nr:DUF2007 domain-containing protein [Candidatus Poribacteria bacterium]